MKLSEVERFWAKVAKSDGCWEWQAGLFNTGYGQFFVRGQGSVLAHRYAYETAFGPVPEGLFVCHHCDNRKCVRPTHLFAGTNIDNMRDMYDKGRQQYPSAYAKKPRPRSTGRPTGTPRRETCKRGHPLVEGNLSVWRNKRKCRTCVQMRNRQYRSAAA